MPNISETIINKKSFYRTDDLKSTSPILFNQQTIKNRIIIIYENTNINFVGYFRNINVHGRINGYHWSEWASPDGIKRTLLERWYLFGYTCYTYRNIINQLPRFIKKDCFHRNFQQQ